MFVENKSLSYPIYSLSGETEKEVALAQQASVNEDLESRRRQLDKRGENQKKLVANQVAHILTDNVSSIHLKATSFPKKEESVLAHAAADVSKAISDTTTATTHAVSNAASSAANTANSFLHSITSTVASIGHTAAHIGHDAALSVQHKASDIAHLAVDTASNAAHSVNVKSHQIVDSVNLKSHQIVEAVENKAFSIADNIHHFTTLVSVLADEENERARRLASGDESRAAANAFKVSSLIRELDPCFYKQTPNLHYGTKLLEESERRWRLNSTNGQLAENNAHKEGKLMSQASFMPRHQWVRYNTNSLEEKERLRRMNDSAEAWSMINAFTTSWLIKQLECLYRQEGSFSKLHANYATTLLEENERRVRIRLDKLQHTGEDNAHHLMDVVNHNLNKFSSTTRQANRFALEFANLVGGATSKIATQFPRFADDITKSSKTQLESISSELSEISNLLLAVSLEEAERARRINDSNELYSLNNAWNQAQLIHALPSFAKNNSTFARYPLGLIEEPERAWRSAHIQANASHFIAGIVKASASKFASASKSAGEREHAKDTALHSRMNPNAAVFVPHQALPAKVEPVIQPSLKAAGAQL